MIFERNLLRSLLDKIPDSIYFKDKEHRFVAVSKAKAEHHGLSPEDFVGKADFDFFSEEHARGMYEDDDQVLKTGKPIVDKEEKVAHPNGIFHWYSVTKIPYYDEEGDIIGTLGISRDITDRKRVEEELAWEQTLLNSLLDNAPEHIYLKDRNHRFMKINKSHADWIGLSDPAQAVGKTDFDFFPERDAQQWHADEQKIMESGHSIESKEELERRPDGREVWVSTSKAPLFDKEGKIIGIFGITRDINKRKMAEIELKAKLDELKKFSEIALGREARIAELKAKVKELEAKLKK